MQVVREVELRQPVDEVWRFLADPDELLGWVGDEVAGVPVVSDGDARRLTWTWAPGGVESSVEVSLVEDGDRTLVRVVERPSMPTASARACALSRWDDALLIIELRALTWTDRLIGGCVHA